MTNLMLTAETYCVGYTCAAVIKILRYDITVGIQSARKIRSSCILRRYALDILIFVLLVIKDDVVT